MLLKNRLNLLFVNPPIYDFTAYDFWLKPYGLLKIAGALSNHNIFYFNFLSENFKKSIKDDGRGKFVKQKVVKPKIFSDIPKPYFRYGAPKENFESFLMEIKTIDAVFITSSMTYWYLGVKEVIESIKKFHKNAKIILGGIYPTLIPHHAQKLYVDLVIKGSDLSPVEDFLEVKMKTFIPEWSFEKGSRFGILTISKGCPFNCSYCAIKTIEKNFRFKEREIIEKEFSSLKQMKIKNVAFYDDSLLFKFDEGLNNFLNNINISDFIFHTPNGLNVKFLTKRVALRLKETNFKNLFLSLENIDEDFLKRSGNKLQKEDFLNGLDNLLSAGFKKENITTYLLFGHPEIDDEATKDSVVFLKKLGLKPHLSEFSPVPKSVDSEKCAKFTDLDEPLNHNKVAFSIRVLGLDNYQKLKSFAKGG